MRGLHTINPWAVFRVNDGAEGSDARRGFLDIQHEIVI